MMGDDGLYEALCRGFSRRVRAQATAIVRMDAREALSALGVPEGEEPVASLGGRPIAACDLRALGRARRAGGRALVVDNTLASSFGCAAIRLGAHVCIEGLGRVVEWDAGGEEGAAHAAPLIAISLSKRQDLAPVLPGACGALACLPRPDAATLDVLAAGLASFDRRRRLANDAAQVAASYLVCHPRVVGVRYPGLKADPSFPAASSCLQDGFGPVVDFRLRDDPGAWRRFIAGEGDAEEQVMSLEAALRADAPPMACGVRLPEGPPPPDAAPSR